MEAYGRLPLSGYQPSLRLVELDFNTDEEATVHATLNTYDCENAPEYDALSYTWGTPDTSANIKLNDQWFPVTPNLLAALEQLRLNQAKNRTSNRKLWIDAICINQSDNSDKSRQVMQMKDIYANASNVLIWTGKADNLSAVAFDTLELFAADDGTSDGSTTYRDILDTVGERKAAIQLFLERPYFNRMWVIQEIVITRNAIVLCGSFSVTFDMLYVAIQRMTGSGFYPFSAITSNVTYLGDWRDHFLKVAVPDSEENIDLRLFLDSRDRNATDLRDKIYSLRGLIANNALAAGITVDYDKSVVKVYTDFTKHLLNTCPDLRILSGVILRHRTTTTLELPSWVPDWSQPKYGGILNRYYRFGPASLFRAAGASKPRVTVMGDSDKICLEGIRLDTVDRIIRIKSILTSKDETSFSVTETRLREMAAEVTSLETYPFTGEPYWVAFFRTLTTDRTALSPRISEDYRAKFMNTFGDWKLNDAGVGQNLPAKAWAEISKSICAIIKDRNMFLTTRGYLGLSQEGFRIGDVVCIFSGGEVPFLLRQAGAMPPYDGLFQFLCECYIHGVMDGEAMKNIKSNYLSPFSIE